jgi:hypothetical protein
MVVSTMVVEQSTVEFEPYPVLQEQSFEKHTQKLTLYFYPAPKSTVTVNLWGP